MKKPYDLSIVIPAYQAQDTLVPLVRRIGEALSPLGKKFEVILVDDGSSDKTWTVIKSLASEFLFLSALKLSRNFGQHNAISAGLNQAKAQWIVVMDCDLQDLPEEIPKLYEKALEGYDIVVGQRITRSDKKTKIWFSKYFYHVFEKLTGLKFEEGVGNFGIYGNKVIRAVLDVQESFRPFPIIVRTVGFNRIGLEVKHGRRYKGESNYNSFNLISGAINTVLYYSNKPIWFFLIGGLGIIVFILFLILGIIFLTVSISTLQLIIGLIVLLSFVSLNIAVIGIYVSRIFVEIKRRPSYIIDELILNDVM